MLLHSRPTQPRFRGELHTKTAFLHKHALNGLTTQAYSLKHLELLRLTHATPFFSLISCALHTRAH